MPDWAAGAGYASGGTRKGSIMKWVTWQNVGIDRMACAWLIRCSIDLRARFVFVPEGSLPLPKGVEPFDIPGTRLSHRQGHCTFHTMLRRHKLKDPVLRRIATRFDDLSMAALDAP